MNMFTILGFIVAFVLPIPLILIFLYKRVLYRRRSIDSISDFLQEVQHHAQDLELALSGQEELREKWLHGDIDSESAYRLAIQENIDRLREYFWRMRRNVITMREFGYTALDDEVQIARQEAKEAEERLQELSASVNNELQEPLRPYPAIREMLNALLQTSNAVLTAIRHRPPKIAATYAQLCQLLERCNEMAPEIEASAGELTMQIYEAVRGFEEFAGLLPVADRASHDAIFNDLIQAAESFLKAIWIPLLKLEAWSHIPLEKWTLVPVPDLASFGRSRGTDVLHAYRHVKIVTLKVTLELYPGSQRTAQLIQNKM